MPHPAQGGVNVFQGVGRAFNVCPVQVQQHVNAVGHIARLSAGQALLQAKNGQVFTAQRKQNASLQLEGHRHAPRVAGAVSQKVRVHVDLVVVFNVETGADLQVGLFQRVRQFHIEMRANESTLGLGGVDQIHPDGLHTVQVFFACQRYLPEPSINQLIDADLAF